MLGNHTIPRTHLHLSVSSSSSLLIAHSDIAASSFSPPYRCCLSLLSLPHGGNLHLPASSFCDFHLFLSITTFVFVLLVFLLHPLLICSSLPTPLASSRSPTPFHSSVVFSPLDCAPVHSFAHHAPPPITASLTINIVAVHHYSRQVAHRHSIHEHLVLLWNRSVRHFFLTD